METKKSLKDLNVGDKVLERRNRYGEIEDGVATIKRLTKTLIITDDGYRYDRITGRMKGLDVWSGYSYISVLSEEQEKEILKEQRKYRMIKKIKGTNYSRIPYEDIEEIVTILNKSNYGN